MRLVGRAADDIHSRGADIALHAGRPVHRREEIVRPYRIWYDFVSMSLLDAQAFCNFRL